MSDNELHTPPERTCQVLANDREFTIPANDRTYVVIEDE